MASGSVEQLPHRGRPAEQPAAAQDDASPRTSPDELLRRAWAIRHLLADTDPDDHATRIRLVAALDVVRLDAAQQWHARGWRPITDCEVVTGPARSFLVAPALTGVVAATICAVALGTAAWVASLLGMVSIAPLAAERLGVPPGRVGLATRVAAVALWLHMSIDTSLATVVLLPPALLLLAIGLVGTGAVAERRC